MKKRPGFIRIIAIACAVAAISGRAQNIQDDPPLNETFFGKSLLLDAAAAFPVTAFKAGENMGEFSGFAGVTNLAVRDGTLAFTLAADQAVLVWGKHDQSRPDFKIQTYPGYFTVKLAVRHSAACAWTCVYRDPTLASVNGAPIAGRPLKDGQGLVFENVTSTGKRRYDSKKNALASAVAGTGSLEFTIRGPAGTRIEITSAEIVEPFHKVYVRHEFVVPPGKIWRAIADVAGAAFYGHTKNQARFYVNGHAVSLPVPAIHRLNGHTLDITPWLVAGTNVVGGYVEQHVLQPSFHFQTRIVMASGELVEVATGPGWQYNFTAPDGWNRPGFDAAGWLAATQMVALTRAQMKQGLKGGRTDFWMPEYQGRLVLANPAGRELVFAETSNAVMEVRIPIGLREKHPAVGYRAGLCRAGRVTPLKEGRVSESAAEGPNAVFRVDLGRLTGGVHVIALALLDQAGNVLETRAREPFLVIPNARGKIITGRDYTEGLDLELEDTIDFTDASDPHPNFESCPAEGEIKTPVIVSKPGLRYRETASWRREAGFSYRIQFKHPGDFYLMEVEYPNDAKRLIEVMINGKQTGVWNNCQSASGAETGGRSLPTGKMEKLQWLHVADPGIHSVDIVNHRNHEKCAASRLNIYRVKGRLPELAAGRSRAFGQYTENVKSYGGVGNVFGVGRIGSADNPDFPAEMTLPLTAWHIKYLEWFYDVFDRYMQYNKFCGRNLLMMGCYQYSDKTAMYLPAPEYQTARISQCWRRMLAQFMDKNGMEFFTEVDWVEPPAIDHPEVTNPEIAAGADTLHMINREGDQVATYNWLHPLVKEKYMELMRDLMRSFGDLKSCRGVHTGLGPRAVIWNIPGFAPHDGQMDALYSSYDDVTFGNFERETGAKTGVALQDPDRFRKRADRLERDAALRAEFLAWRGAALTGFFTEAAAAIRRQRADLSLAMVPALTLFMRSNRVPVLFEELEVKQIGLDEYLKNFGINLPDLNAIPGVFVGRWAIAWLRSKTNPYNSTQDAYTWLGQTAGKYTDLFNRGAPAHRYVMLFADWNESWFNGPNGKKRDASKIPGLEDGSDWMMTRQLVRCHSQFGGLNAREPVTHALIAGDPDIIAHGFSDLALPVGHEQALRSIVRVITALPAELFSPVLKTRLDTNLAIRRLQRADAAWFYVANPCQWPVKGTLALEHGGNILTVPDGENAGQNPATLPLDLEPFGVLAFKSDSPACQITGYRTEPLDPEWLERLAGVIHALRTFIKDNASQFSEAKTAALEAQIQAIEATVARGEYALAWTRLTDPEMWQYYIYEPSCEARIRKALLRNYLTDKPAALPPEFKRAQPPDGQPRVLTVKRATGPIKADGILAEADWQGAAFSSDFRDWERQTNALVETGVAARFDDQALYLALVCADPDTARLEASASGERNLWAGDDALGILLYPQEQGCYYQFGFNSKRARFDQQVVVGGKALYDDYRPEWQFASTVHPQYWLAEARIPWKAMDLDRPPEKLSVNFFRSFRYNAVEGGFWSPTPSVHGYDYFGRVNFE